MKFPAFFFRFVPRIVAVSPAERLRAAVGACLGILIVGIIGQLALPASAAPLLIAPLGASAVLLFAVPASPLAQPWSIIGGNGIAALVGVLLAMLVPDQSVAAALALGVSIGLLLTFKCLHPPSGAVALTAVLGGPAIHDLGFAYVLWPVLAGSGALLLVALGYNKLTGKAYPHPAHGHAPVVSAGRSGGLGVTVDDLTTAIRERDEVVPVDPDDLEEVLQRAEVLAFNRRSGGVVAAAVMSQQVASVQPGTSLRIALKLLRSTGVKALPVVDAERRVVGIVTQTDFLDKADWGPSATGSGLGWRLRAIGNSDRPLRGKVRDVMTVDVRCVLTSTPIARVVQVMAETGHHHVPVVDGTGKLAGMVTQSDVVAALFRVNQAELELSA
jgi:CBS domain-containing membrane protein